MNTLSTLLKKNPELLSKYISLGLGLVDKAVTPLNKFMQHLLSVQGIDPNTQPGETARVLLTKAIDNSRLEKEDYDASFDFSPVVKAFEKTSSRLEHLKLTKEQFKQMTDLSKMSDEKPNPAAEIAAKIMNPIEDLKTFINAAEQWSGMQEKFASSRQPTIGPRKSTKAKSSVVKTFKKGVFRRIKNED